MTKVALVVGGSKGVGLSYAITLSSLGYKVLITYHLDSKSAQNASKKIQGKAYKVDIRNAIECSELINIIYKEFGQVDVLINNVGDFIYKPITQTRVDEFQNIIETNLMSSFYLLNAIFPIMKKQKYGKIILIGSSGSQLGLSRKLTSPYYAAKSALHIIAQSFAAEGAPFGINVNMISPGIIKTSIVKKGIIPAGRMAEFSDLTNALEFLISDKSNYINGANIEVTGAFRPGFE